jgi:hypothetical protein
MAEKNKFKTSAIAARAIADVFLGEEIKRRPRQ